jgi:hypothetical protein
MRAAQWLRLKNKKTGAILLFVNHHGPLSVNSGGGKGGATAAQHLIQLVQNRGKKGDIVVLVGDFNANAGSLTIQELWKHLVLIYNGHSFGGVDNIFTNAAKTNVVEMKNLGSGGSDHDALTATIMVPGAATGEKRKQAQMATSDEPVEAVRDAFNSQCGKLESDTKYTYYGHPWSKNVDGPSVGDPRACCELCKRDARCHSWIWLQWVAEIKASRCIFMGAPPTGKEKVAGGSVMSGLPAADAAKAALDAAKFAIDEIP